MAEGPHHHLKRVLRALCGDHGHAGRSADRPFDIAEWLRGRGLGHAWVPADSGATPECGQGGPLKGLDAIKRREREWMPSALRGWVSSRALLNSGKRLPYWLGGWWAVQEEPYDTGYFSFDAAGKVSDTTKKSAVVGSPPVVSSLVGSFSVQGMFGLNIMWSSADVDETLMCVLQAANGRRFMMEGKTARSITMKATRMQTNYG